MATNLVNKMTVMKHCKRLLTVVLTLCLSFAFACGGRGADTTGGTTGETPSVQPDGGNDETGETPSVQPDGGNDETGETSPTQPDGGNDGTGATSPTQPDGGNDGTGETPPNEGDEDSAEEEEKEDVGKVNPDGSIELPERPA